MWCKFCEQFCSHRDIDRIFFLCILFPVPVSDLDLTHERTRTFSGVLIHLVHLDYSLWKNKHQRDNTPNMWTTDKELHISKCLKTGESCSKSVSQWALINLHTTCKDAEPEYEGLSRLFVFNTGGELGDDAQRESAETEVQLILSTLSHF